MSLKQTIGMRIAVALGVLALSALAAADGVTSIDVPAGDLATALKTVSRQAGVNLVFTADEMKGMKTGGVSGNLTARQAVEKLLEGTPLRLLTDDKTGAMLIAQPAAAGKGAALGTPADLMRVSSADAGDGTKRNGADSRDADSGSDQITVRDRKTARPFGSGNIDVPRTINDVQPYYVFDAKTLETSGAVDVEDFLKQRLTMNTVAQTNSQRLNRGTVLDAATGTASNVDLRGVGATLVLVNGRRVAGYSTQGFIGEIADGQADLNGIPLNAIERIEVLPTSASGIYGGEAIGGVVNVILKKSFQGGQVGLRYENALGDSAPRRNVSFSYGGTLEEGRTRYAISGGVSDGMPVRFKAVADRHLRYFARAEANLPNHVVTSASSPYPGALTNLQPRLASVTALTFDDGTPLGARIAHIPLGLGPDATFEQRKEALLGTAGVWNTDLSPTRSQNGLYSQMEKGFEREAVQLSLTRQMSSRVEASASFSYNTNNSDEDVPVRTQFTNVPAGSPFNPFQQDISLRIPHNQFVPGSTTSISRMFNTAVVAQLPADWVGTLDYTWSENRNSAAFTQQELGFAGPIARGELNLFVDPALLAYDIAAGGPFYNNTGRTRMQSWMVRGQGPLFSLPWGQPRLVAGADYRATKNPSRYSSLVYPAGPSIRHEEFGYVYFPRNSSTSSAYAELLVPLVKQDTLPFLHALEVQAAGRADRFEVDGGTLLARYNILTDPPAFLGYSGPVTADQQPIYRQDRYGADSATFGLKYQPVRDLTLRASLATAFRPPLPSELIKDEKISDWPGEVTDPRTNATRIVDTIGGGNPDLSPQNSESLNLGLILAPQAGWGRDLRLNLEYYRIRQFDSITTLSAQQIVDRESLWPERVTRDADGQITLVDVSRVNLFGRETEGWDFSIDYARSTPWGTFRWHALHTFITALKTQYAADEPAYDAAGFHPSEGGAPKHKGNLTFEWQRGGLSASWAIRYFGSYKAPWVAGGPNSQMYYGGALPPFASLQRDIIMQGGDSIDAQSFHDLVLGYAFDVHAGAAGARSPLSGMNVNLGIRNVFDTPPAYDASFDYFSPYGENRPRSFWVGVKKTF